MSAMSLAGLGNGGGSGDDEKVKEEKKRTEAERQKNGNKTNKENVDHNSSELFSIDCWTTNFNLSPISAALQRKLEATQEELMRTQMRYQKEIEKLEKINKELKKQGQKS